MEVWGVFDEEFAEVDNHDLIGPYMEMDSELEAVKACGLNIDWQHKVLDLWI